MSAGAEAVSRVQDRECPICGEMKSGQGIVGHLRWGHGEDPADWIESESIDEPSESPVNRSRKLEALVDRLEGVRERQKKLRRMYPHLEVFGVTVFGDPRKREALEQAEELEEELVEEIRSLRREEEDDSAE